MNKADSQLSPGASGAPLGSRLAFRLTLLLILLLALFLRVDRLNDLPLGVDYDEAGNFILAQEIAAGQSRPIFITAYAGREAVFYWLAALSLRLFGANLFAFRLTSALCGLAAVLYAYLLAREMFSTERALLREGAPLLGAASMAVSYWSVHVGRYGFRVNAMTPILTAMIFYLWRGLRRGSRFELAAAGVLCGLAANTYLAIRAFPLTLIAFALWVIWGWPLAPRRRSVLLRMRQLAWFGLCALIAFAPLGIFFIRYPQYFSVRMAQTSIFDPEIHGGDLGGALWRVTLDALGIFTVRGDSNPVYNFDRRPIFGPVMGAFFYLGLLFCLWRLLRAPTARARTPFMLVPVWLLTMLIPNILGARGVPHSLRSMGLTPVVYFLPALGMLWLVQLALAHRGRLENGAGRGVVVLLAAVILVAGGAQTYHRYFNLWAQDAGAYYRSAADVRLAAEYLGRQNADEVELWVSNDTYRHTTLAAFCKNYAHLRWVSGATLVFPADRDRPLLYVFDHTNPLDPVLSRYIPQDTLQHRELGPDGEVGFEAYLVTGDRRPEIKAQYPAQANLGNIIALLGYDLNAPAVSGETLDVTLYWRVLRAPGQDDDTFFVHLVDDLGFRWGGETFFRYPSAQWRPGEVIVYRLQLDIAAGAPPGTYRLTGGVFSPSLDARLPALNEAGQLAGTTVEIGAFELAPAARAPETTPAAQQPMEARFGETLLFLGSDRDRSDLRPGETLALTLYWQAQGRVDPAARVSIWLEREGRRVSLWAGHPVHGRYPFDAWQEDEFVRDRYALRLPADVEAGDYQLYLAVDPLTGDALDLGAIHVRTSERRWTPPAFDHPVGARLGDKVTLVGYTLDATGVQPGGTLHLTLIWRCENEFETNYTVFTHLLDHNEQVRAQQDNPPLRGTYPTTLWVRGEVVVDEYDLAVDIDAPPGEYAIEVGLYDPVTMRRLPVFDPTGAAGDRVLLGTIRVRSN